MHAPISAQARGEVRLLCARLELEADKLLRAITRLSPVMLRATTQKSSIDNRRAMRNVIARLPIKPIWEDPPRVAWRFLRPLAAPDDDIEMKAILLGGTNRPTISIEEFGLRFSRHALARLFDRSAGADPVKAMYEAHDALLRLAPVDGEKLFALPRLLLPAANGCFLTVPSPRIDDGPPLTQAQSWLSHDMTFPSQDTDLRTWRAILETPAT